MRRIPIFVALVIVLSIAALFIMFIFRQPEPVPPRVGALPAPGLRFPSTQAPGRIAEEHAADEVSEIKEKKPVIVKFSGSTIQLPPLISEELQPLFEAAKRIVKPVESKEEISEVASAPRPAEIVLTPDEVFRVLYPDFYISALKKIQDILVELGVIPSTSIVLFINEAEIRKFNDIFFKYLRDQGAISEADYRGYLEGAAFLFDRPYREKYREAQNILALKKSGFKEVLISPEEAELEVQELLRSQGLPRTFELLPEKTSCNESESFASRALSLPVAVLFQFLHGVVSEAQAVNIAGIICFRTGGLSEVSAGVNFSAPCCSCKIKKTPVGCLDICSGPAIWDPLTKICGCNV